jgi:hypothetical protein
MSSVLKLLVREILFEEIGRNYHTLDPQPNTWDSFQDFEIEYYPQNNGTFLLDLSFKGKKLVPLSRFGSQEDAKHYARMVVDKFRVGYMNSIDKEIQ